MATVKELQAQAKAAGHTGTGKLNKAALEALLAGGSPAAADPEPAKPKKTPSLTGAPKGIGVPTEPDRGGLNDLEREQAGIT